MRLTDLLDPREAPEPPLKDSVDISFQDLHKRSHELPSKGAPLRVANLPGVIEALDWLTNGGRMAALTDEFQFGPSGEFRLWSPTSFLEQKSSLLKPGKALDIGCGTGRDAVFLASLGWHVTAVDILPDALDRGRDLAARYAPHGVIEWVQEDAEATLPSGKFDLVTMFRFFDLNTVGLAAKLVGPGGLLLIESFSIDHQRESGHPRTAGRAIDQALVRERLGGFRTQACESGPMIRISASEI